MSEHPNLTVMKRMLQAFGAGDMATLSQLFAEDIVWRMPGTSIFAKEYRGRQEVFGLFGWMMEASGGTFKVESRDMLVSDAGGVLLDRVTAARNGRTLDVLLALHLTIHDGRVVEGVDYLHQEHLWDAFWA